MAVTAEAPAHAHLPQHHGCITQPCSSSSDVSAEYVMLAVASLAPPPQIRSSVSKITITLVKNSSRLLQARPALVRSPCKTCKSHAFGLYQRSRLMWFRSSVICFSHPHQLSQLLKQCFTQSKMNLPMHHTTGL